MILILQRVRIIVTDPIHSHKRIIQLPTTSRIREIIIFAEKPDCNLHSIQTTSLIFWQLIANAQSCSIVLVLEVSLY